MKMCCYHPRNAASTSAAASASADPWESTHIPCLCLVREGLPAQYEPSTGEKNTTQLVEKSNKLPGAL